MNNAAIAIQLLIQLLTQASEIGKLIQAARAEGRDISDVELDSLAARDTAARADLAAAIAAARARDAGG